MRSATILELADAVDPGSVAWWPEERQTWRPPEAITVSEWADRSRIIPARTGAQRGPWRTERTPYLREIMDAFADRNVERITFRKSTQVGGTELLLNVAGYLADQDPQPCVVVVPREKDAEQFMRRRLIPTFEESPDLARHMTGAASDQTVAELGLARSVLYCVTSQSPADLASKAAGWLAGDEADKWPGYSGDEAAPWDLAVERTRTFPSRKIYLTSTPVLPSGLVTREFEAGDRRTFRVPCPECGAWQPIEWDRIRWPEELESDPDRIRRDRLATLQCAACEVAIPQSARAGMLARGVWCPAAGEIVDIDGIPIVEVDGPPSSHRSYQISALYSPWVTWGAMVAEWLRLRTTDAGRQHFTNSLLGLPWEEVIESPTRAALVQHVRAYDRDTLPAEHTARVITIGVDVQVRHLVYAVRAWGLLGESWLLRAGTTRSWETLEQLVSGTWCGLRVRRACVDARYRTDEVEEFARKNRDVVIAIKGVDSIERGSLYSAKRVDTDPRTGRALPGSLLVWSVDVHQFRDRFAALLAGQQESGPRAWHLHVDPASDYVQQVTALEKVQPRRRAGRKPKATWELKPGHRRKDYHDAELYALVAATMIRADNIGHTQHGPPAGAADDDDLPPETGRAPPPPPPPMPRPGGRRAGSRPEARPEFLDVLGRRDGRRGPR